MWCSAAQAPATANAFHLTLLLEELRQHGDHASLGERLGELLAAEDVAALCGLIFARCERDYDTPVPGLTAEALGLLSVSRQGLTETELCELIGGPEGRLPQRRWSLLRQAVNVLLEGTPPHLALDEIESAMCAVPGVRRVHDLHVWTLTSGREAMSAHVVVDDVRESERLLEALHALLHARFGIDHTTMQLETEPPVVLRINRPSAL